MTKACGSLKHQELFYCYMVSKPLRENTKPEKMYLHSVLITEQRPGWSKTTTKYCICHVAQYILITFRKNLLPSSSTANINQCIPKLCSIDGNASHLQNIKLLFSTDINDNVGRFYCYHPQVSCFKQSYSWINYVQLILNSYSSLYQMFTLLYMILKYIFKRKF